MSAYKGNICLGINYWPAKKAMYWWRCFDPDEVEQDFARLAAYHFDLVRIFLVWEDFQPHPDVISQTALDNLLFTADCAANFSLTLMPTFFCGHMSGVNWLPDWMISSDNDPHRFLLFSQGFLRRGTTKNFYADQELMMAQAEQIRRICQLLDGHPAIHSFDLGNEASNLVIPFDREQACEWLSFMTSTIKNNTTVPITLGMHAEDLEEDRHLWPQDAARFCDFLCMHAYPFYLSWVSNPLDHRLVPFLCTITQWLGQKPVVMQEFGAPSIPLTKIVYNDSELIDYPLFSEAGAAGYYYRVLAALKHMQMPAVVAWCYADYDGALWSQPPLSHNKHERYFGLFRHDGQPKPSAYVCRDRNRIGCLTSGRQNIAEWIPGYDRDTFYQNPRQNLVKMFASYQACLEWEV